MTLAEVRLSQVAHETVDAHACGDTTVECGGVLVGTVDDHTVRVLGAIPARRAVGAVTSLTFTHEAWEEVNDVLEADWPGHKMVGWYHSHPGFGIFLSDYDQFIQSNFFSEPWQVAYVVDPLLGQSGFFGWADGRIVRHSEWAVMLSGAARAVHEPPPHEEPYDRQSSLSVAELSRGRAWLGPAAVAIVALLALSIGYFARSVPPTPVPLVFGKGSVSGDAGLSYMQTVAMHGAILEWQMAFRNTTAHTVSATRVSDCAPTGLSWAHRQRAAQTAAPVPEDQQWQACQLTALKPKEVRTVSFRGPVDGVGEVGLMRWSNDKPTALGHAVRTPRPAAPLPLRAQ